MLAALLIKLIQKLWVMASLNRPVDLPFFASWINTKQFLLFSVFSQCAGGVVVALHMPMFSIMQYLSFCVVLLLKFFQEVFVY
jgi:hypothetical protein